NGSFLVPTRAGVLPGEAGGNRGAHCLTAKSENTHHTTPDGLAHGATCVMGVFTLPQSVCRNRMGKNRARTAWRSSREQERRCTAGWLLVRSRREDGGVHEVRCDPSPI